MSVNMGNFMIKTVGCREKKSRSDNQIYVPKSCCLFSMIKIIILGSLNTRIGSGVAKTFNGYTLECGCLLSQGPLF